MPLTVGYKLTTVGVEMTIISRTMVTKTTLFNSQHCIVWRLTIHGLRTLNKLQIPEYIRVLSSLPNHPFVLIISLSMMFSVLVELNSTGKAQSLNIYSGEQSMVFYHCSLLQKVEGPLWRIEVAIIRGGQ